MRAPFKILHCRVYNFWCASYLVDLDDIQWNETSTARNFNNRWPLFDLLKIQNVSNFYFEKGAAKKNTNFPYFLESRYFVMGDCNNMNVGVFFFTTSETELDYYHQKVSARVASRIAERLKT